MCMYKIFGNILPNTHSTYVTITQFLSKKFFLGQEKNWKNNKYKRGNHNKSYSENVINIQNWFLIIFIEPMSHKVSSLACYIYRYRPFSTAIILHILFMSSHILYMSFNNFVVCIMFWFSLNSYRYSSFKMENKLFFHSFISD